MAARSENISRWILLSIPLLSLVMHLRVFSLDLMGPHVWRQAQTQTTVLNFYREDMNILNPRINGKADTDRIQRLEFPLMQWIYAWFYKAFGNHIMITRILCFIMGVFTVFGIFRLFRKLFHDPLIAAMGAWVFNFSPLFYYYTMNPLPDMFALCLGVWGIAFFLRYNTDEKKSSLAGSAVCLGLAVAVKLPYILFMVLPGYMILYDFFRKGNAYPKRSVASALFLLFGLLPAICWYAWVIPQWKGNMVVTGMINNQRTTFELLDIVWSYIISMLPELLINYAAVVFFVAGLVLIFRKNRWRSPVMQGLALWGVGTLCYLFFELNAIGKEHDYYLLPFLPLIFILVTAGIHYVYHRRGALRYIGILLLVVAPVTAFLRADSRWNPDKPSLNIDVYRHKEELRNLVPQDALCIVGNDISQHVLLYYIDKKGFVFDQDLLYGEMLKEYIVKGAEYLFTDSRNDEREDVLPYLEEKIFDKGTLRVYKLKTLTAD